MKKYPLNKVEYYAHFREMIEALPEGRENAPGISWFTRKGEQRGVTLSKLREDVRNLQTALVDRGLAGKHIAILGENSYEWLLVYFAATYCGAVAVCVDVEQPDDTIRQMLEMADVGALFFMPALEGVCEPYMTTEGNAFYLSGKGTRSNVDDLIAEGGRLREKGMTCVDMETTLDPDATASIVFTSGTTNYSKPVMLSHRAILTNASDALTNVAIGEVAFTSLPF